MRVTPYASALAGRRTQAPGDLTTTSANRVHVFFDMYPKMANRVHVFLDMYPKMANRVHVMPIMSPASCFRVHVFGQKRFFVGKETWRLPASRPVFPGGRFPGVAIQMRASGLSDSGAGV